MTAWTPGVGDFSAQEKALVPILRRLEGIQSVLDLGCGYGRAWHLMERARLTPTIYVGVDVNAEHLAVAREKTWPGAVFIQDDVRVFTPATKFDLVIALELLMHLNPRDFQHVVRRMTSWSKRYVLTCDWTEEIQVPKYDHNWRHDYRAAFGPGVRSFEAGPLQKAFLLVVDSE